MGINKIAVDVVLIPPEEIIRLAIDINKKFSKNVKENYILDAESCTPHITLLMGLVEKAQLPEVSQKLSALAKKFSALNIRITKISTVERVDGRVFSKCVIEKNNELQRLHEEILEEMKSVFGYDGAQKEMFFSPPKLNEIPLSGVKGFAKTSASENYKPHITLGFGRPEQLTIPVEFKASRLALCHLGNYCTCRDILWFANLEK